MTVMSPLGAALGGAVIAVAAGSLAPTNLIAFYLTALAAAVLLFAAFMAYLDAAERLDVRRGAALAGTCLALFKCGCPRSRPRPDSASL